LVVHDVISVVTFSRSGPKWHSTTCVRSSTTWNCCSTTCHIV